MLLHTGNTDGSSIGMQVPEREGLCHQSVQARRCPQPLLWVWCYDGTGCAWVGRLLRHVPCCKDLAFWTGCGRTRRHSSSVASSDASSGRDGGCCNLGSMHTNRCHKDKVAIPAADAAVWGCGCRRKPALEARIAGYAVQVVLAFGKVGGCTLNKMLFPHSIEIGRCLLQCIGQSARRARLYADPLSSPPTRWLDFRTKNMNHATDSLILNAMQG